MSNTNVTVSYYYFLIMKKKKIGNWDIQGMEGGSQNGWFKMDGNETNALQINMKFRMNTNMIF